MGMFDRVMFRCPSGCAESLEVQSKAGKCFLQSYTPDEVPTEIAMDIVGELTWCEECGKAWTVRVQRPKLDVMPLELADA